MIFSRKKKCPMCRFKMPRDEVPATIRVGAADGIIEMDVCRDCANFMDLIADNQRKRKEDDDSNSI